MAPKDSTYRVTSMPTHRGSSPKRGIRASDENPTPISIHAKVPRVVFRRPAHFDPSQAPRPSPAIIAVSISVKA